MKKYIVSLILTLLYSMAVWSSDGDTFTAYVSVPKSPTLGVQVKMTFKIISELNKTCQIGDDINQAIGSYPDLTKLELPDKVKNYTIVRIGDYAFAQGGLCDITTVVLPSHVTSIGKRAFYLSDLESITFPSGFNSIGEEAFADSKITSIDIPSTVSDIDNRAFASCTKLTSFTIPSGVSILKYGLLTGCTKLTNIVWHNGVTSIGNSVFAGCTSLTSISIPESATTIGVAAFADCTSLSFVTLLDGLTDIQESAFSGCTRLNSITIPNSVTTLGSQVFYNCTNLSTINLSPNLQMINHHAFYGCKSLRSITIPTKVSGIGSAAFQNCTQLESISIPGNVKTIDSYAFCGCTNLGLLELSEGITTLGYKAFGDCISLASLSIPSTINTWGSYSFSGCKGLTDIKFANGVTSIGGYAFKDCTSITSLSIPNSITTIGGSAFEGCNALQSVTTEEGLSIIGSGAFLNCTSLSSFIIPQSITSIGRGAFGGCQSITSITIPNNIISLNGETFYGCTNLVDIKLSDNLTTIQLYDFYGCAALQKIIIPKSVTFIGSYAFNDCNNLTSITIDSTTPVAIDENTFSNRGNATLYVPSGCKAAYEAADYWKEFKEITESEPAPAPTGKEVINGIYYNLNADYTAEVTSTPYNSPEYSGAIAIPATVNYGDIEYSVTSIGENAFRSCIGLTSVTIPNSMTSIGIYAFSGCTGLTSVNVESCTPLSIKANVFSNRANATLYVPAGSKATYEAAYGWKEFKEIKEMVEPKVELNKTKAAIEKGKSLTLKATVTPETLEDKSVTWTSSDTKIATVSSSGKVKGVKTGTATITCTSKATGAAATCEVIVGSIKVDQTEIVLEKGKTQTLKSTVYPSTLEDKSVTWTSSDTKIATVSSSGKVKGVKTGTATITCTSNATGLKATCEVTVGSIKIDQKEVVLEKGKSKTLKSTVYPSTLEDKSVTWTSSDTKIATVSSSGKVKGVKTGTATITCTSIATGLTATCKVTVGSIKISQTEIVLEKGKTQTLKSTVYPSTLEDKSVTWKSSDKNVATVSSSGKVKGIKGGTATITCTSNATGLSASCTVTVLAVMESRSYEGGIDVMDKTSEEVEPFDVYDLSGRKVRHQVTSLDGLPKGIYIVNGKKIMK